MDPPGRKVVCDHGRSGRTVCDALAMMRREQKRSVTKLAYLTVWHIC